MKAWTKHKKIIVHEGGIQLGIPIPTRTYAIINIKRDALNGRVHWSSGFSSREFETRHQMLVVGKNIIFISSKTDA